MNSRSALTRALAVAGCVAFSMGPARAKLPPDPPPTPLCPPEVEPRLKCPRATKPVLYCPTGDVGIGYPFGDDESLPVLQQTCVLVSDSGVGHGPIGEWRANGARSVAGRVAKGVAVGAWTFWYSSGNVHAILRYKAGEPHGRFATYNFKTRRKEVTGLYRAGERAGRWAYFDDAGKKVGEERYGKDGFVIKTSGNTSTATELP